MRRPRLFRDVLMVPEAAKVVQLSPMVLRREIAAGKLPAFQVPGTRKWLILAGGFRAWVEANGLPTDRLETWERIYRPAEAREEVRRIVG